MITPIINGVIIDAILAQKLKMPPVNPPIFLGAMSEISVQPRPTIPWPKNAIDIIIMTAVLLSTQLAMMMQLESSSPEIIGSFLLIFTELVFFIILSDTQPPKKIPIAAARNGQEAKKPT